MVKHWSDYYAVKAISNVSILEKTNDLQERRRSTESYEKSTAAMFEDDYQIDSKQLRSTSLQWNLANDRFDWRPNTEFPL